MKYIIAGFIMLAGPVFAQITVQDWHQNADHPFSSDQITLEAFQWQARPIIVFADSPFDPLFMKQMNLLHDGKEDLIQRDILWIYDTNTHTPSELRMKLRPHGFGLVLIGKDGDIKLRNAMPWDMREISRVIDKMPMRQLEIIQQRKGN